MSNYTNFIISITATPMDAIPTLEEAKILLFEQIPELIELSLLWEYPRMWYGEMKSLDVDKLIETLKKLNWPQPNWVVVMWNNDADFASTWHTQRLGEAVELISGDGFRSIEGA